jgi:hypothetical protein
VFIVNGAGVQLIVTVRFVPGATEAIAGVIVPVKANVAAL